MIDVKQAGDVLVITTDQSIASARETLDGWGTVRVVWITHIEADVEVVPWWELSDEEEESVGLLDADGTRTFDPDRLCPEFVRYRGSVIPLNDFSASWGAASGISSGSRLPYWVDGWHGYLSDSFFSGALLRFNNCDYKNEPDFSGQSGVTLATFIL